MRVLVLSALLACAAAAPSGALLPLAPALAPAFIGPVALPAVLPTISPGDIQAAAINAKVAAEDQARALTDQARELSEKALDKNSEKIGETTDVVKEQTEEVFWAGEEQKWQALDAVMTAQAKLEGNIANIEGNYANIEGAIAKNAEILAKSVINGVVIPTPIIARIVPGFVAPTPLINTPEIAPKSSIPEPIIIKAIKPEENNINFPEINTIIATKSAEIEPLKEDKLLKSTDEKPQILEALPLTAQIIPAPIAFSPSLKLQPWLGSIMYISPGLKTLDTSAIAYQTPYLPGVFPLIRAW